MNTLSSGLNHEIVIFAGTLGDAFLVLCKLYNQHKLTGNHYSLIRYNLRDKMDAPISAMFKTVPFIEYVTPYKACDNLEELYDCIKKSEHRYVTTRWEEDKLETFPVDYVNFDPFPVIITPEVQVQRKLLNVGIQLHCGAEGSNFRGFSLEWLKKIRTVLDSKNYCIYIFGTGATCYSLSGMNSLCKELNIINMVGKTDFHTFMGYTKAMDYYISFEGFGTLFAMSQRVKTLLYNQYPYGIDGTVHPQWYKHGMIIHLNRNIFIRKLRSLFNKRKIYSPAIPKGFFKLKPGSDIQ